jgi:hypothetical protein
MKKIIFTFTAALFLIALHAQKVDWKKIHSANPDKILLAGERQPTKVLLLGTFHFGYPNADGHKVDSSKFIDVLSPARQKEMEELAQVIQRFKPTRIYVEGWNASFYDSLYKAYLAGNYKLGRNEIYQLGFRVAKAMGLEKVYPVDASSFSNQYYKTLPVIDSLWKGNPVDSLRDQYWDAKYKSVYSAGDSLQLGFTMLENFLFMAEPMVLNRMHGHYISGGFNTTKNEGADILAMWWYSRNLRIFNNILKTRPSSEDRIIVLFGNGHMPILKHCFQSSPEFEVVELKSLLK